VNEQIQSVKLGQGCLECGYKKAASALVYHHLFGKDRPISECKTTASFEREAAKCIVLCANCHAELHECESPKKFA